MFKLRSGALFKRLARLLRERIEASSQQAAPNSLKSPPTNCFTPLTTRIPGPPPPPTSGRLPPTMNDPVTYQEMWADEPDMRSGVVLRLSFDPKGIPADCLVLEGQPFMTRLRGVGHIRFEHLAAIRGSIVYQSTALYPERSSSLPPLPTVILFSEPRQGGL